MSTKPKEQIEDFLQRGGRVEVITDKHAAVLPYLLSIRKDNSAIPHPDLLEHARKTGHITESQKRFCIASRNTKTDDLTENESLRRITINRKMARIGEPNKR